MATKNYSMMKFPLFLLLLVKLDAAAGSTWCRACPPYVCSEFNGVDCDNKERN